MDEITSLLWIDRGVSMPTVMSLKPWCMVNHFSSMVEICRKDNLARNLNRIRKLFPTEYDFYPETWWLPHDFTKVKLKAASDRSQIFICKPDSSSQGRGIFLAKHPLVESEMTDGIVQAYIQNPLILYGYKFDFRVYALVTSCDPLTVYLYREGLARFCTAPYASPDDSNMQNTYMHLTNYAINKGNERFNDGVESKRYLSSVFEEMQAAGLNVSNIWTSIQESIIKTLLVAQPYLKREYQSAARGASAEQSQCFEVLGFDIMLDSNGKPWVIEVNSSPSLTCDADIDKQVKSALITDTLKVVGLHDHQVNQRDFIKLRDKRTSLDRLHSISPVSPANVTKAAKNNDIGNYELLLSSGNAMQYKDMSNAAHGAMALDRKETLKIQQRRIQELEQLKKAQHKLDQLAKRKNSSLSRVFEPTLKPIRMREQPTTRILTPMPVKVISLAFSYDVAKRHL